MSNQSYQALIVDDEAGVRILAIRALQGEGFSCDSAADGVESEEKISSHPYDVVVTDLRMPNKNGRALTSDSGRSSRAWGIVFVVVRVKSSRMRGDKASANL